MCSLFVVTCALLCVSTLTLQKIPMRMSSRKEIYEFGVRPAVDKQPTPVYGPQMLFDVGTPPQQLGFSISTLSGDSYVIDYFSNPQPHREAWEYFSNESTTLHKLNTKYAAPVVDQSGYKANISGIIANEIFCPANISINLRFALIESVSTDPREVVWIPDQFATGILGLGFYSDDNLDLFLPKMLEKQESKSFGLILQECLVDGQESIVAEIPIGGLEPQYCDMSTAVTSGLVNTRSWDFIIDSFMVDDVSLPNQQIAAVNIAEMLTGVPQKVYNHIAKIGNAKNDPNYIWPIVDCDATYPTLHFTIGGQTTRVGDELYVYRDFADLNTPCHLMIYPMRGGGFRASWSFGYLWVYEKCMLFDYGNRSLTFTDYSKDVCKYAEVSRRN